MITPKRLTNYHLQVNIDDLQVLFESFLLSLPSERLLCCIEACMLVDGVVPSDSPESDASTVSADCFSVAWRLYTTLFFHRRTFERLLRLSAEGCGSESVARRGQAPLRPKPL